MEYLRVTTYTPSVSSLVCPVVRLYGDEFLLSYVFKEEPPYTSGLTKILDGLLDIVKTDKIL